MKNLINPSANFPMIAFLLIAGIALSSCAREEITPITSAQTEANYLHNPMAQSGKVFIPVKESFAVAVSDDLQESAQILPSKIWQFVDLFFPGETIEHVEFVANELKAMKYFLVILSNGVQLRFTLEGDWVKSDETPHGNGTDQVNDYDPGSSAITAHDYRKGHVMN